MGKQEIIEDMRDSMTEYEKIVGQINTEHSKLGGDILPGFGKTKQYDKLKTDIPAIKVMNQTKAQLTDPSTQIDRCLNFLLSAAGLWLVGFPLCFGVGVVQAYSSGESDWIYVGYGVWVAWAVFGAWRSPGPWSGDRDFGSVEGFPDE